jgi:hypothetical protein
VLVGFNYPNSYELFGADIGPNPHCKPDQWIREKRLVETGQIAKVPQPLLFGHLQRNLENLKKMGFSVVRFFLLGNGFNWEGIGPRRRPPPDGPPGALPYDDWEFIPTLQLDPRFTLHFEQLLKGFRDAGLQIIPSFIDFHFTGKSRGRDAMGLAPQGRADCIKDPAKRHVFLSTVLNPLVKVAAKYRPQVYAFEVINEPYWCWSPIGPLSGATPEEMKARPDSLVGFARRPEVTEDEMNTFVGECIEVIHAAGLPSTVGHRYYQDLVARASLPWQSFKPPTSFLYYAGSKPQFHFYGKHLYGLGNDPPQIKDQGLFTSATLPVRPFLGEFDSALNGFGPPWSELPGAADTTANRLRVIEAAGCDLAMLWPDQSKLAGAKEDRVKLALTTRESVVQYTGGVLPPTDE